MRHRTSHRFWRLYRSLPPEERELANRAYAMVLANPDHPSLRSKRVGRFWSARVGRHYCAVAKQRDYGFLWIWIGPHDQYEERVG
ncbi:MAG: hypothetical protein HYU66_20485 [Armatimonadetes bacterium]|nr:hypothetical protein [Armatimonadota bacterium]